MPNSIEVDLPLKRGTAHYIVSEVQDQYICREEAVMAKGNGKYPAGMVLGRILTGGDAGKFRPFNPANTDGSQTAAAILYEDVDTTRGNDVKRTITARLTEVQRSALSFAGAFTDAEKAAAYASLAVNNIVMR